MDTFKSAISNKEFPDYQMVLGSDISSSLFDYIHSQHGNFTKESYLSVTELQSFREQLVIYLLSKQLKDMSALEKSVFDIVNTKETLSDKLDDEEDESKSMGQRVADHVATFGGSWTFIISFGVFLVIWITFNIVWLANKGFDPYPFILLNLILSCIAALQAPVIMMSQNRQEEKDRERGRKDYMINLKAEVEIRTLHEKMDHLIIFQQQEIMEVQKLQIEMMNDILKKINA